MLPIQEMFYSCQCEGPRINPSLFCRISGCNLRCAGFGCKLTAPDGTELTGCDTIRAANPKFKNTWDFYDSWESLTDKLDSIMPKYSKHNHLKPDIVITGGEPLLYWKDDILQGTIQYYLSRGHHVTIETNASLNIEFTRKYQDSIMFSMSVKLSASGEPESKRLNPETVTKIVEHCPSSYLKFVINPETWDTDYVEICNFLKSVPAFVDVYLMPLGGNKIELDKNCRFVIEKAIQYGFKYSDRLHIRAWDDKPGV